jgi:uncharacterized protein YydD (DUF2326 family)
MFIKNLRIYTPYKVIRDIKFRKGINLIIDESEGKITGNSVGKTTVLKLIDYCFGAKSKIIWEDPENRKQEYSLVKEFLISNEITVSLCLTDDLDNKNAKTVIIERNFIQRGKSVIRRINGNDCLDDEFEDQLCELFFPNHIAEKPTFRQIISHNIRYEDLSLVNTLRTLDKYTTDAEYETLHLYLFGCDFKKGNRKQEILESIKQEEIFKKRLEKEQTKSGYEATLTIINKDIDDINKKKADLNINVHFKDDIIKLDEVKYLINKASSEISKLNIRKTIIIESKEEIEKGRSDIDIQQLKVVYSEASAYLGKIQKTFEELVEYHNKMISEKIVFIMSELPQLEKQIAEKQLKLDELLKEEIEITNVLSRSDTFEELETLVISLNEKYRLKGEYEVTIEQLNKVDASIAAYTTDLDIINEELFSSDFETTIKKQLDKFNTYFTSVSKILYNEQYALKYDIIVNKKGQKLYKFTPFIPFGPNVASGKKQGEISSFDIAYTLFADEQGIPCMHFILNDKKELMHDNQLVKITELVNRSDIQFVASMLKDKLPSELNNEEYFILKLSEDDKLFKIEQYNNQ